MRIGQDTLAREFAKMRPLLWTLPTRKVHINNDRLSNFFLVVFRRFKSQGDNFEENMGLMTEVSFLPTEVSKSG